jgi:hypothetical protein
MGGYLPKTGLPDFSLYNKPKWEKYTNMAIKIPHFYEIHQNCSSQGLPSYTKIGIFGMNE